MSRSRLLVVLGFAFILLLLGLGAGVWWYLFGANKVVAAELVPGDTIAFATIPNAADIVAGYQTSHLKTLVDSPNAKPLIDEITKQIGQKNLDLITAFAPNLSGQSFIALTHLDPDHPERIGFVAAMKPKAGLADFDAFVAKLNATWPDILKQGKTGKGNVSGVDYQWNQGPGAPDKMCVAQINGWVVTTWGEASLQDWIERYKKKSATPSLAQNPDYIKTLSRVGHDPMTLVYVNYHVVIDLFQKQMAKISPAANQNIFKKLASLGGFAMGTRFENGEIVDRFSVLMPHQAQLDSGIGATPCPFETLKFTGPNTRFYWASSVNCQQYWKNVQEQYAQMPLVNVTDVLQKGAQSLGLDLQHNIIDPLGSEFSIQAEWNPDSTYPEIGFFLKLDKPDDFKPTVAALIDTLRKTYAASALIKELNSNGQSLATLNFVQASPFSPTITEGGPYLGIFLTADQAARSFQRDETAGLPHNAEFNRQIGDKRNGASQIIFVDTPQLLDRTYRTAMPYLSMASMFNKDLAAMLKGRDLPPDLTWLAPIGTWSCVSTPGDDGMQGYSVSGIGNQGIFLALAAGGGMVAAQNMGLTPVLNGIMNKSSSPNIPPPAPATTPPDATPPPTLAMPNDTTAPAAPTPAPAPDAATNAAPAQPPAPTPDYPSTTNSTPNATPPTPDAAKSQ